MFVNFSEIGNRLSLFVDYIENFENVAKYYGVNFRNENYYTELFEKISSANRTNFLKVAEAIEKSYAGKNFSNATKGNIEKLKASNAIVILTELKLSLFGGKFENLTKIITAIKLASHLEKKFDAYHFVPVVYFLTEENDFVNSSSVKIFDDDFKLVSVDYDDGLEAEENRGRLGNLTFKSSIRESLQNLSEKIHHLNFYEKALELANYFKEGNTFGEAVKRFYSSLFDKYGVLLFDPNNLESKKILEEIFKQEIENHELHSEDAVFRSADIEENYETVVKVRPVNLKMTFKKGLYAIEPFEGKFKLKRKRQIFKKEELLRLIEEEPVRFTPTTMLRSVSETFLFPVAFVVSNEEETVAYAQNFSLFKFFNATKPLVFPAASVTLSEFSIEKTLNEFNLTPTDFFNEGWEKKIFLNANTSFIESIFQETKEKTLENFSNLKKQLIELEPSFEKEIETAIQNSLSNLESLKQKALATQEVELKSVIEKLRTIRNFLFPNENLQGKEIAAVYFIARYGEDVIPWLFNQISIEAFQHQLEEI